MYLVFFIPAIRANAFSNRILNNHHVKVTRDIKASKKTSHKYIRSKRKTKEKNGFTIKQIINKLPKDKVEKADMFSDFFCVSVFTKMVICAHKFNKVNLKSK